MQWKQCSVEEREKGKKQQSWLSNASGPEDTVVMLREQREFESKEKKLEYYGDENMTQKENQLQHDGLN